jgi:hypothetical protein
MIGNGLALRRLARPALPLLAATALATGLTLTAGTSQAHALARGGETCGPLLYAYWYWGDQYVQEFESAGYDTEYAQFAYSQVQRAGDEIVHSGC